ncbi:23790_t:CDS:1, partial [Dentiscutata erythropus]
MKNFIFVFSLFAIFLTVNAVPFKLNKRATSFNACPPQSGVTFDPLTVTISPDPPVEGQSIKFDVNGTLTTHDITAEKTVLAAVFASLDKTPISNSSQPFDKSFPHGTPFSKTLSDVSPADLPNPYAIVVIVGDPTGDPENPVTVYG